MKFIYRKLIFCDVTLLRKFRGRTGTNLLGVFEKENSTWKNTAELRVREKRKIVTFRESIY